MLKHRDLSDNRFQLDALDGIRGLAVLIVFLSHTSNGGDFLIPYANFSGVGKSGVYLFFVLSAFLLTVPFIAKGRAARTKSFLLNYLFRRFFRIYPLYLLYLLMAIISTMVLWRVLGSSKVIGVPFTLTGQEFINHLLLLEGKGVTWSILVEFRYYFVLPVLALTYSTVLNNRLLPSAVLTTVLIVLAQLIWPPSASVDNDARLGYYLPIFFMGSFLALVYHHWQAHHLAERRRFCLISEFSGWLAIAILIIMIPSVTALFSGHTFSQKATHQQFAIYGFLWSVVVFASITGVGYLKRFFELPVLRYLGFISFSFYLFHVITITAVEKAMPTLPIRGWLGLLLTIAVSHITWLLVEKPSAKLRLKAPTDKRPALVASQPS
jgi:peptidoglycan/LPS O-acetylase OafA/YrhL